MPPNTTHFLWLICLRFARQMARDVRSKLHTYGAGDPDRAMALADLVIQDPLMQLAFDMLPSVLKQLTTTRHCAIAEATEAAAWLAAAHAARRAYIALVQCDAMEKDELPLCVLRSVD